MNNRTNTCLPFYCRPWSRRSPSPPALENHSQADDEQQLHSQNLNISDSQSQIQALSWRPDRGGTLSIMPITLSVNNLYVDSEETKSTICCYVDGKLKPSSDTRLLVLEKAMKELRVDIPNGLQYLRSSSNMFSINIVKEVKISKLDDYVSGNLSVIPRGVLQGIADVALKDSFELDRSFYGWIADELLGEIAVQKGAGTMSTASDLILSLNCSFLAFRKPMPVIEFLKEHVPGFRGVNDVKILRQEINSALKGLKVRVNHGPAQKYTIAGLTQDDTCNIQFELFDPQGNNPPEQTSLVHYFKDKWEREIMHQDIPCLVFEERSNIVPMELCELIGGQKYKSFDMNANTSTFTEPWDKSEINCEMVWAERGPSGDVARSLRVKVHENKTKVTGRVIGAPKLKLGGFPCVKVDADKCQWNLLGKSLVDGKSVDRWALLDFTDGESYNKLQANVSADNSGGSSNIEMADPLEFTDAGSHHKLQANAFVKNLRGCSRKLGVEMAEPVVYRRAGVNALSSVNELENLLKSIVEHSGKIGEGKLQMIVCVMINKNVGYKFLKYVSETKIGVVTQCCLSSQANEGKEQYLVNLCLKLNAKLGGSNFELVGKPLEFDGEETVMFIGANVNHPIAAVVGTVNWPAANRYVSRISPQVDQNEKIQNFGSMCSQLVDMYAQVNQVRPSRIIVFRGGAKSEEQFEMVRSEELLELKNSIYGADYQPKITVIVAQKRHQTQFFVENSSVPPGTVVDTTIVHPYDFDFYMCSHFTSAGNSSKPTHYHVLWDENFLGSDEVQKLIYDLCFTFALCTRPVSLRPPLYYADLVARRGRLYQEVAKDLEQCSSHASISASPSPSFCSPHSELENVMFFV